MADSARWCERCVHFGDHHTDRHPHRPTEDAVRDIVRQVLKSELGDLLLSFQINRAAVRITDSLAEVHLLRED